MDIARHRTNLCMTTESGEVTMTLEAPINLEWTLGDRLHKSRKVAGISVEQMAQHLGVSRNTITNWEKDEPRPKRHVVLAWADVTGAPIEWLTEEADSGPFARVSGFGLRKRASGWRLNLRELPLAA